MKKDRKRKKETLFLNEKLRGFVITVWKKFIPLVQCCPCWIEHDVVLLKSAQPTGVSCWIPWRTPILHLPLYVVGDAFGLVVVVLPLQLLPDVPWQLCVSSLFLFPKGPSMAIPPGLEVGGSTSVGFDSLFKYLLICRISGHPIFNIFWDVLQNCRRMIGFVVDVLDDVTSRKLIFLWLASISSFKP